MTWFKVDDSFYDHPKVFDAPDSAVALWTRAGSWAARNLTDGFVPANMPARLCNDADAAIRELVARGLWRRTKGGYQFHDWGEYQPTRESVEEQRAAARDRMQRLRAGRKAAGQRGNGSREQQANFARSSRPPTRPDPNPPRGGSGAGGPSDPAPPDWRTMPAYGQAEPAPETPARAAAREAATRARRTRTPRRDALTELRLITEETA